MTPILVFALSQVAAEIDAVSPDRVQIGRVETGRIETDYVDLPEAKPPYYRVRFVPSEEPNTLIDPVSYTVWIPPGAKRLRGLVVHQHGCGPGSCRSGATAAYDLHWQALAKRHDCGLLAATYEQPDGSDCVRWCDPRNGSEAAFRRALGVLAAASGRDELDDVPWALWGHSGGGVWCGGMALLHPNRVVAAYLRSGVPPIEPLPDRPEVTPFVIPDNFDVPLMLHLGIREGVVLDADGPRKFDSVWPRSLRFFRVVRGLTGRGRLHNPIGITIDPNTMHECGNTRYLAIPWFDELLTRRLGEGKIAEDAIPTGVFGNHLPGRRAGLADDVSEYSWLPSESIRELWRSYRETADVPDTTPPPAPTSVRIRNGLLVWGADADPESGLRAFVVERDGEPIATVTGGKNPRGRNVFQGLQYSDTPSNPLVPLAFRLEAFDPASTYTVRCVNTVGLESAPSLPAKREVAP